MCVSFPKMDGTDWICSLSRLRGLPSASINLVCFSNVPIISLLPPLHCAFRTLPSSDIQAIGEARQDLPEMLAQGLNIVPDLRKHSKIQHI